MIDKVLEGPMYVTFTYSAPNARPYPQQVQLAQAPYRAFN